LQCAGRSNLLDRAGITPPDGCAARFVEGSRQAAPALLPFDATETSIVAVTEPCLQERSHVFTRCPGITFSLPPAFAPP